MTFWRLSVYSVTIMNAESGLSHGLRFKGPFETYPKTYFGHFSAAF